MSPEVAPGPVPLSRGGLLVRTPAGPIQYGAVPETIKDTIGKPEGVPAIYLLPGHLFSAELGISLADLEFPVYYNYFVKRQRTTVICEERQKRDLTAMMREAVFGPVKPDVSREILRGPVPDLAAEFRYFRTCPFRGVEMDLGDMLSFVTFDRKGIAKVGSVTVSRSVGAGFVVLDGDAELARFPEQVPLPEQASERHDRIAPFHPPAFGLTFIGTGHGFDPETMTSGFIIWANHRGILVDPPVGSMDWLRDQEINPKLIDAIVLTHCHADHDGGTLQKVLAEGRIRVFTTPTIMRSFVAKNAPLAGLSRTRFTSLFDFTPVGIGEPVRIEGAEFHFRYSLHSVPCVGFEVFYGGRSLVYSSDTLYDPATFRALHRLGVIDQARLDQLMDFPWHHDLVLHEAGIPPLHTRLEELLQLPEDVRRRVMLIHLSARNLPEGTGMRIAPAGLDQTVALVDERPRHSAAQTTLDVLSRVGLFSSLPWAKAAEAFSMTQARRCKAGDILIRRGDPGGEFFIIVEGKAAVLDGEGREVAVYGQHDYFGEAAIVLGTPRTADVVARSDLEVLTMAAHDLLYLLRGTELLETLRRLARIRQLPAWDRLAYSPVFRQLTPTQRTQFQGMLEAVVLPDGTELTQAGQRARVCYLIDEGIVVGEADDLPDLTWSGGELAGEIDRILDQKPASRHLVARGPVTAYRMSAPDLRRFLQQNPGVYLRLTSSLLRA
ncbi:MAG: cyclic nucleotide-binding domain-containing protein [Candidatus Sericytochromatia bacterium]|nr:cyclic nucleotide-binding domain-containing protein [Candidatus Sericytochromatia bacterium]